MTIEHAQRRRALPRWSPRLSFAIRLGVLGDLFALAIGLADHFLSWPFLTSAIGPTAYLFIAHPRSLSSRVRNASIGHGAGIAAGLAGLAVFGLWAAPSVATTGRTSLAQEEAAAVALTATLAILQLAKAYHAPAAAICILVATGLAKPMIPLAGLVIGLAAVILAAPLLAAVPLPAGSDDQEFGA